MKFRTLLILMMAMVLTVGLLVSPAEAKDEQKYAAAGPMGKFGRGILNTATGWMELFLQPAKKGAKGIVTGPAYAIGRTVVGPVEVVTFLFPNDTQGNYDPIIRPATPFESSNQKHQRYSLRSQQRATHSTPESNRRE